MPETVARTLPARDRRILDGARTGRGGGRHGEEAKKADEADALGRIRRPAPAGPRYRTPVAPAARPEPTEAPAERATLREERESLLKGFFAAKRKSAEREDLEVEEFSRRAKAGGESGARAVQRAEAVDALKFGQSTRQVAGAASPAKPRSGLSRDAVRSVGARTFVSVAGIWVEQAYDGKVKAIKVKAFSEGYFELIKLAPNAKKILSLGDEVIFRLGAKYVHVGPDGLETLQQLKDAMK